jgi:hypothetical protein
MSTNTKESAVTFTNNIEPLMQTMGTPTLKAIAAVFELQAVRLYSVAKQPKEGVAYDPHVYNWDAIERFVTRRLDAEKGLGTLEAVIAKALEIDKVLKETDGRRGANRGEGDAWNAKVEVDGVMVAKRRFKNFEQEAGLPVVLKQDPEVYAIVLQTATHTVMRPLNSEKLDDFKGNDVKVISNGMMNMKGMPPSKLEAAVKERFSGEFAKKQAEEAAKKAEEAAAKAKDAEAKKA